MVFVQHLFGIGYVDDVVRINIPRKCQQSLKVSQLHVVVRRLRVDPFQFAYFFFESFAHFASPFLVAGLFSQFFHLVILSVAQLVLNILDLLLQEIFTLLAIQIFASTHLDILFESSQLHFLVQHLNQPVKAVFQIVDAKQGITVFLREREVRTDEVDQDLRFVQVLDGKSRIRTHSFRCFYIFGAQFTACIHQGFHLVGFLYLHVFLNEADFTLQVRTGSRDFVQIYLGTIGLENNSRIASRHFKNTQNFTDHSYGVKIFKAGSLHLAHFLSRDDDGRFFLQGGIHQLERTLSAYSDRHNHRWEHYQIAESHDRKYLIQLLLGNFHRVGIYFG